MYRTHLLVPFPCVESGQCHIFLCWCKTAKGVSIYIRVTGFRGFGPHGLGPWVPPAPGTSLEPRKGLCRSTIVSEAQLDPQNSSLGLKSAEKHLPSRLQSDLKVLRTALGAHLKTYGIYGVGGTLDHLWRSRDLFLFLFISQAPTFPGF